MLFFILVCNNEWHNEICLAITEPSAGSDVASLSTTAVLSADGTHYIVNGEKVSSFELARDVIIDQLEMDHWRNLCWFLHCGSQNRRTRNGWNLCDAHWERPWCHNPSYALPGFVVGWHSVSFLLCFSKNSNTVIKSRYVTFEDVKVPVQNLIGQENQGFKCIH